MRVTPERDEDDDGGAPRCLGLAHGLQLAARLAHLHKNLGKELSVLSLCRVPLLLARHWDRKARR